MVFDVFAVGGQLTVLRGMGWVGRNSRERSGSLHVTSPGECFITMVAGIRLSWAR